MPVYPSFPEVAHRSEMWHDEATVIAGAALTFITRVGQPHNVMAFQTPFINGDSFTNSFFVKAGSYTLYVCGETASDRGILDWYLDNEVSPFISGQDWYSAVAAGTVIKTGTLTVTDGYHKLRAVVNGKNASSTNYGMGLTNYWLKQAID